MKSLRLLIIIMTSFFAVFLLAWKNDKPLNYKKENQQRAKTPLYSEDLKLRMEQRAIITTIILKNPSLLDLYVNAVKDKLALGDQNDEAITFDEIATERPQYVTKFAKEFKSAFKSLLIGGGYFRASKFIGVSLGQPSGKITTSDMPVYDEIFFNNDASQIYFPYSEDFKPELVITSTLTYHPLRDAEENEGFRIDIGSNEVNVITVDENYAQVNPVFIVNFNEEEPAIIDIITDPPPPSYTCNFLTYNTYSDVLDDRYVITVTMPKIKLLKNFRSFIGGTNLLTIMQCFAKPGNLNVNPSPALDPITADKRYVFKDFKIKRKNKGKWVDFGQIYNDDWRLIQYDNPLVAFYKTGWFTNPTGSTDVNVSGGVGLDTVHIPRPNLPDSIAYQWVTSFNAGASAKLHIDMGNKYDFIGTDYISRRGMLANCVGDNFGNGTATDAGETTPWALRRMSDKFLFYFKVRECHQ